MPRGDGTGPMGMGAMTGRGAGFCTGVASSGYTNVAGYARGFGCGRGFGRMFNPMGMSGRGYFGNFNAGADVSADNEKELLSRQAEVLENQLQQVKKRILSFDEDAK